MAINEDVENGNNSVQTDIREPLIQQRKIQSNEEDGSAGKDGLEKTNKESDWMVYLSTFVAVWGSYEFGCCAGYSSPTQAAIREDLPLSLGEFAVFGSILTIGAMIGAITSGPIADFVGRKGALRTSVAFCLVGWISIYFAEGALALDFGRLATGYGMGVFSYVVPVFIAEIAPKNLRGGLTTVNQLMICTGVSVSFVIGTVLKWRTLALTALIPCAILLVGLCFIPESPRWLAKIGRHKDFEVALQKLRGPEADISHEAAEIQDYIDTLEQLPKARMLDLFQRRYLRSVIIGVGLMICQQFGGINGICFYVSEIFVSSGFPSKIGNIIYAVLQVVLTALGATLIDKAGRRALLLTSGTGLVIGCLITALSFYLKAHGLSLEAVPTLAVTGILVYIGSFSIGMGAVPWVVMSEIFPINIKGVAGSLATLVNWFGAWVCSYTFNYLMSWSSYGTFIIYAVINALAILFIATLVPETKGRTLEEIQAAINKS
ncbi:Sugar transporter erd6-like [Thalictrum thalictroides]|uniref:Sugar transporter erd6-like n=1 Tax=Thalictrum thalictroides TaxID=46969 RepID=A0A7J6W1P1_THATH|nr:Sugar transporter erd6-like [Thalictrum thalictroides]